MKTPRSARVSARARADSARSTGAAAPARRAPQPAGRAGGAAKAPRTAPAARVPLTRERIVEEALRQIDRDGLAGFSTRRLGEALGVQAMSLYHHFPSKAHVLDAALEYVLTQFRFAPDAAPLGERLRTAMRSYRDVGLRYPGFFPHFAVHRMNLRAGIAFIDKVIGLFNEACPGDPERAARLFRVAGYYLNGVALEEAMGYGRGPSAQDPAPDDWVAQAHPAVERAGRWFAPAEHEKTFELGMEMLMRELGLGRDAPAASTAPDRTRARRAR